MSEPMSHPKPEGSFKSAPDPWGYYYLRYFVGAVIGAGLLLLLWKTRPTGMLPPLPDVLPSGAEGWLGFAAAVTALGTAGLAYCYVASAPILLLHGVRLRFAETESFWWGLRILVIVVVISLGAFAWPAATMKMSGLPRSPHGTWLCYGPYGVVMLAQLIGVCWGQLKTVREGYHKLARSRALAMGEDCVYEYVESYRHLREHGNALLIIIMEVVLAGALYATQGYLLLVTLLVIWILPASFSWFLGTWLEQQFPSSTVSSSGTTVKPAQDMLGAKHKLVMKFGSFVITLGRS